jgi:hypothetical protein
VFLPPEEYLGTYPSDPIIVTRSLPIMHTNGTVV